MKVLFLTTWYPHRYDAMAGLFVRKHAEAVARHADVCVLYLHADRQTDRTEIVEQTYNNVREITVYYPQSNSWTTALYRYCRAVQAGWRHTQAAWGLPDITHAHVFLKPALMAYCLQLRYGTPYVVTEHWSGYLPANGNYERLSRLHRWLTRLSARKSACVMPVSSLLQQHMQQHGIAANYQVVGNVVDDFFYLPPATTEARTKKRIVHISCFDEAAKNIRGLLRAVRQVAEQRQDFELVLIGTGADYATITDYAGSLHFPEDMVRFTGEQTPEEVCRWLYNSDFLLMFSNYETAGIIFSECWACGKPIVSTPVGILANEESADYGIFVKIQDEAALGSAVGYMLDHYQDYNPDTLRAKGREYSYQNIGARLTDIYRQALSGNKTNQYSPT